MQRIACLLLSVSLLGCAGSQPAAEEPWPSAEDTLPVLTDLGGQQHDLEASLDRGESVAFIFWQTWCGPCRKESPEVVRAVRKHGERIRFLGVVSGTDESVDEEKVARALDEWGYRAFPQVRDRDLGLTRQLKVEATPTIVILGENGRELFRGHRVPEDWSAFEGARLQ